MAKEKVMPFVEARARLSEIVDRVAEHGDTYVVAKRQKPVAVIIGIDRYRELSGTSKHLRKIAGKRILKIGGIAKAIGGYRRSYSRVEKVEIGSNPSFSIA